MLSSMAMDQALMSGYDELRSRANRFRLPSQLQRVWLPPDVWTTLPPDVDCRRVNTTCELKEHKLRELSPWYRALHAWDYPVGFCLVAPQELGD